MPTNAEIANILETLAELMELDGVNKFRFLAVQKAARRVAEANFSIEERAAAGTLTEIPDICLLYTSPSPRDRTRSRMPSSA